MKWLEDITFGRGWTLKAIKTRSLNFIFVGKKYDVLFCFTIYSTLLSKSHLASTVISLLASKVEYIVR